MSLKRELSHDSIASNQPANKKKDDLLEALAENMVSDFKQKSDGNHFIFLFVINNCKYKINFSKVLMINRIIYLKIKSLMKSKIGMMKSKIRKKKMSNVINY